MRAGIVEIMSFVTITPGLVLVSPNAERVVAHDPWLAAVAKRSPQ
jgi:hypothetical protein